MGRTLRTFLGLSLASSVIAAPGLVAAPAWSDSSPSLPTVLPLTEWAAVDDVQLAAVSSVDVRDTGVAVIADSDSDRVFEVDAAGGTTVLAGTGEGGMPEDGDTATESSITAPQEAVSATSSRTFVSGHSGAIHLVEQGEIETIIPHGELANHGSELSLAASEDTLYVGTDSGEIYEIDPDSPDSDTVIADLDSPLNGLDVGSDDTLYAATLDAVITIEDGGEPRELFPADPELGVDLDNENALALDVSVAPDGTVYSVGDSGLIVIPPSTPPTVYPTVTGDKVGYGLAGGVVVSDDRGNASLVQEDESPPMTLATPGRARPPSENNAEGTVLPVSSDPNLDSVLAMTVTETGTLTVVSSNGTVDVRTTGSTRLHWRENDALSSQVDNASIVAGRDGSRFMLVDGALHRLDLRGASQVLAVGTSLADRADRSAPPELVHLAGNDQGTYVASRHEVYVLDDDGTLVPFTASTLAGDDEEIVALAAASSSDTVYAAVDTGSSHTVVRVPNSGRPSKLFDSGDVDEAGAFTPTGLAVGPDETLYVTDGENGRVLRHFGSGSPETIAGDGESSPLSEEVGMDTQLTAPATPTVDSAGTLYFTDGGEILTLTEASSAPVESGYPLGRMTLALVITLGVAGAVLFQIRRSLPKAG